MPIIDKSGVWLVNRAQFAMHDPESNTRFEPGEPTKATLTAFVRDQPTIVRCADPSVDLDEKAQAKLDAQVTADETERLAREVAAAQVMASAGTQADQTIDAAGAAPAA